MALEKVLQLIQNKFILSEQQIGHTILTESNLANCHAREFNQTLSDLTLVFPLLEL
jgi:hypothetical protein